MAVVFWADEYSVGNKQIDEQHEHIVAAVNALEIAVTSGEGAATVDLVLDHLLRYLAAHFAAEERLMSAVGYPNLAAHVQQHEECKQRLSALMSLVQSGEIGLSACVPFITEWLHGHLLGSDQLYVTWLHEKPAVFFDWARQISHDGVAEVAQGAPGFQP